MQTWPVASGSLLAGFAVAQATGVRPLGGVVLLAGVAWCARGWLRRGGVPVALALVLLYAGLFAVSHLLAARGLGAWGSVLLVSAVMGGAAWSLSDARERRRPPVLGAP